MSRIRVARDVVRRATDALRWAVARLGLAARAVKLHQHRVIDVAAERILNRREVHLVAISRELDPIRDAFRHIAKEVCRAARVTQPDQPRQHKFRLCFNRDERPDVTHCATRRILSCHVLLFCADERPDFINLYALRGDVADRLVLIPCAGRSDLSEQAQNRPLGNARET